MAKIVWGAPAGWQEVMREEVASYIGRCEISGKSRIEAGLRELEPTAPDSEGMSWARYEHDGTYTLTLHLRKREAS